MVCAGPAPWGIIVVWATGRFLCVAPCELLEVILCPPVGPLCSVPSGGPLVLCLQALSFIPVLHIVLTVSPNDMLSRNTVYHPFCIPDSVLLDSLQE